MNKAVEALADWKQHKINRQQFLRQLLSYDRWMVPRSTSEDEATTPFQLGEAQTQIDASGSVQLLLFSCGDTVEEFDALYSSASMLNPIGWQVFSADLTGIQSVVIDQGSHHEFVIAEAEFPEWTATARQMAKDAAAFI